MSEPDSGSDLASVRTRAVEVPEGWRINGTKIWTSNAHECHYMILTCRTRPPGQARHEGISQFLIDLKHTQGIAIRPIANLAGEHHFNEVVFTDCVVPADALLGREGEGWNQVMNELGFERSGPERFLSSYVLLVELVRAVGPAPPERAAEVVGRMIAHLTTLRRMSKSVAGMLQAGRNPNLEASLVKDLGAVFEQEIPELARQLVDAEPTLGDDPDFAGVLGQIVLHAPSFSIRGGTREILRGIIARGLGLR